MSARGAFKALLFNVFFLNLLLNPALADDESSQLVDEDEWIFDLPLEELVNVQIVSAAKTSEKIEEIPASVVLITREEIEYFGYATLAELLEHIPGLYQIDDYQEGSKLGVRGFWSGVPKKVMISILFSTLHTTKQPASMSRTVHYKAHLHLVLWV